MENSEIMTEIPEIPETEPEQIELVTEITLTAVPEQEIYTTTECQTLQLNELNVEQLNTFTFLGIGFILGCILVFVSKGLYRFLNIFF